MKNKYRYLLDKVNWLHFIMFDARLIRLSELELTAGDLTSFFEDLTYRVYEIEEIIQGEKDNYLIKEALIYCKNIRLSLQHVSKNRQDFERIFTCEIPALEWNCFNLINQFIKGDNDIYRVDLENRHRELYSKTFSENILIVNLYVDGDVELLRKNVAEVNKIISVLKRCELVTISHSEVGKSLLDIVSNRKKIYIQYPVSLFKIPPHINNGDYLLKVPLGKVIPNDFSIHLLYLIKNNIIKYEDESGVVIEKMLTSSVPYYNGVI